MNNNDNGFTLVELVVVIIVLTVLAASAIPRLTLTQGYAATTDRDQLIALLISVQTRAMQNTDGDCYAVSFTANTIGMLAQNPNGSCNTTAFYTTIGATDDFLLLRPENAAVTTDNFIQFDNLGRPFDISGNSTGLVRVSFANEALCIESEGYVHVCP